MHKNFSQIKADAIKARLANYTLKNQHKNLPESAVLIPVEFSSGEPKIYFVQRSLHLNKHAGQIAFPGGKREKNDVSIEVTALRETEEEIHLKRTDINVLAQLNSLRTRYNLSVTPFVGEVLNTEDIKPDLSEVDEVFAVTLSELLDPKNRSFHKITYGAGKFSFPSLQVNDKTIWGLTYFILADFLNHLCREDLTNKKQKLPTNIKPTLLNKVYQLVRIFK